MVEERNKRTEENAKNALDKSAKKVAKKSLNTNEVISVVATSSLSRKNDATLAKLSFSIAINFQQHRRH
jgi:hypothetical protein